jgi:eukaryotic-like serine/threonine-protein kinase
MALAAGTRIGPYEILSALGAGGMGEVYKARDSRLGREVALKILPSDVADNPGRRARFETEAKAASALNHPGIVTVFDIGEDNGTAYIVTEFVDGATLRQHRPESLRRQLDIAAQTAEALAVAHAGGITHRDLKPENIMVTRDGRAKILDFGLARQSVAQGDATVTAGPETMPGTILGTAGYMSPEQARGKVADHRSDIFSLGAVLYELFSGKRAFEADSVADSLAAILTKDAPDLPDSLPAGLRQIIERCLEKDVQRRFQSAQDLSFALRAVAGSSSSSQESIVPATLPKTPSREKRQWWLTAIAAALAVVFGLGFWRLATEPQQSDRSRYRFKPFAIENYPETSPAWSPDGKSIVYVTRPKVDYELVVKSLDGSPPVVIARNRETFANMSFTPDGSRIYYTSGNLRIYSVSRAGGDPAPVGEGLALAARLSPDGNTLAALMLESAKKGGNVRVLRLKSPPESEGKAYDNFLGNFSPNRLVWSPDGTKILLGIQATPPELRIFDVRSGKSRLVSQKPTGMLVSPAWLPDNRRIIVAWPEDDGGTNLWLLDTETGKRTLVLAGEDGSGVPALSRDGTLAYMSDLSILDLMEIPLDGSAPKPLLASRRDESSVSWSPVAPEFAYVTQKQIRLRRRDGTLDRAIVSNEQFPAGTDFLAPSFSPDGARIVYVAYTGQASFKAWISAVAGGAPTPLGDIEGAPYGMTWSPDGRWIAFTSSTGVYKIAVGSSGKPEGLGKGFGFAPSWSPDSSRILTYLSGGLAVIPVAGGEAVVLGEEYEPLAAWSKERRYIYAIRMAEGKRQLGRLDWEDRRFQAIVDIPMELNFASPISSTHRLSLAPDGKSLATTIQRQGGDIWLLEGFAPPASLWQRLWRR